MVLEKILGLYGDYIGMMEKKIEAIIEGLELRV